MIFAANLKCNHTRASFKIYAEILNKTMGAKCDDIIVFPPSVAFLENENNFIQGAQNFYPCVNGAFTGELGKEHLDEFGIKCVLIGHSERRALGDEEFIKAKFDFAKEHGYKIVFCIGEDLKLKNSNQTLDFLKKQLEVIDLDYKNLIIAYEPIYSIGSGVSAKKEDIAKVLEFVSSLTQAPLLYGGSVNGDNIKDILNIKHCSGVLVGSAALKAENFIKLIKG
ncbi:triose-phosphate isomerase [Campylobacter coli]|uniref:triose-phosphate isomerase n=1 Tax=Campylobacter coli TaxID=195 RepID=UPI0007073739|nr:triose-phosphate isomerase [Campylobacter coli]HEG6098518.1 triose-phosphate isomerase [Campylobacter jejuni]EAJ3710612.1 triose-phosphate isomerase [Campylobacter coli]EIU8140495.1 triose-phosphate isomerase [Campylobacter coli]EKR6217466.1 triose-phosphate isomerase [Campylobacter coli]KQI25532.1 triosephosphate isomerase [Campylobacter coli CVM 41963]